MNVETPDLVSQLNDLDPQPENGKGEEEIPISMLSAYLNFHGVPQQTNVGQYAPNSIRITPRKDRSTGEPPFQLWVIFPGVFIWVWDCYLGYEINSQNPLQGAHPFSHVPAYIWVPMGRNLPHIVDITWVEFEL